MIKKTLVAFAIAAPMCANASSVYSTITGAQLWSGPSNLNAVVTEEFVVQGTADDLNNDGIIDVSNIDLSGQLLFEQPAYDVRITFALSDGLVSDTANAGTVFTGGSILIETSDDGIAFTQYELVEFSETDSFGMLAVTGGGHAVPGTQDTAGLVLQEGKMQLPGLWDGVFFNGSWDNAVAAFSLFGSNAALFLEGELEVNVYLDGEYPSEVPLPASAWLFGAALTSLFAAGRKRIPKSRSLA